MKIRTPARDREDAMMMAGHWSWLVFLAASAVFIWCDASGAPQYGLWAMLSTVASLAFLASFAFQGAVHDRRLCERCAASSPLDPQRSVTRWKAALRLSHAKKLTVALCAVLVLRIIVEASIRPAGWLNGLDIAVQSVLCVCVVSWTAHSRLQAWCPWCNWGSGGKHEQVPDPDPAVSL